MISAHPHAYAAAVRFLESFSNIPEAHQPRRTRQLSLARTSRLLRYLGNPQAQLRTVHITGTAGKGSVAAMVQAGLVHAGRRTGLFTSPHSVTAIERIQVNHLYIGPQHFADVVHRLKPAVARVMCEERWGIPTYFEMMFAAAMVYFCQERCSYIVVEVGVGGRYDPTNVLKRKVVAALTNIGFDHMHLLGTTLSEITYNKAGIIRPGCTFFTSETRPALLRQLQAFCRASGVPMHRVGADGPTSGGERNRQLAAAILRFLHVPERAITAGLRSARLPCRFECVQNRPKVILDGAHSLLKMKALGVRLSQLRFRKLLLVFAMAKSKHAEPILRSIVPAADVVFCTRFLMPFRKCHNPVLLAHHVRKYKKHRASIQVALDPFAALDRAIREAGHRDVVLVTGSFFLAGDLRKKWFSERRILRHRKSFF